MTGLVILVLGLATVVLWTRADRLDRRLRVIEPRLDMLEFALSGSRQAEAGSAVPVPQASEAVSAAEPVAPPPAERDEEPRRATIIPAMREEPVVRSEPIEEAAAPSEELAAELAEPAELPNHRRPRFDFEDLFGRLLPIWAGGVALAVAGFFLVRYSIEQGLLGPTVRTALGFLFGTGLIAGAELAYRQEHRIADPRVRQALAGAGLATLYASFYMAGSLYGLIGPGAAFVGLALVTAAAIGLSFRFGLPSAILGLVGGFAAPVLVSSDETNLPLLALYLALVTGGLSFAGQRQGRSWLALAALAGGLGWGVLMLLSGVTGSADIVALGGYIVLLGAVIPAFTGGPSAPPLLRAAIAAIAALQLAALVSIAGYDPTAWSLYLLLAAALAFFAWREPRMREASGFAALLALWMLGMWSDAPTQGFVAVTAGLTAVFALVPLAHVWRRSERITDVAQIVLVPLGLAALVCFQFWRELGENGLAFTALGFAAIPTAACWRRWKPLAERLDYVALAPLAASAILIIAAGWFVVPPWAAPLPPALVAAGVVGLAFRREQGAVSTLAWIGIALAGLALIATGMDGQEFDRLAAIREPAIEGQTLLRWFALLLAPVLLALRPARTPSRFVGEVVGTGIAYGLAAQFLPGVALGWLMAVAAVGLALLPQRRMAAASTALAISLGWAVEPLFMWLTYAGQSLGGEAMLMAGELGWRDIALRIAPPLVALGAMARSADSDSRETRAALLAGFGILAAVAGHIAFKQVFAISTPEQFMTYGLAERTVWQAILIVAAAAMYRFADRVPGLKLAAALTVGASLAHFTLYSLLLHNPMVVAQAVGPWPLANLVLAGFAVALGGVALLRQLAPEEMPLARRACDVATMGLIVLGALLLLRQAFAGTILLDPPVGGTEDLLRSLLGIVLAIGFLGWGAYRQSRSWRIGSLVLMLVAVLKVFLLDAAGLEGLARIASFMALGFSLIGIGWFYTRQLSGGAGENRGEAKKNEMPS
ncbi:DUF2339 domain-containing protein [Parerythrobacter lacustris]|uniref:DUF2339 domain-containing protein n=1 Tax=Parerythrobacter lacustris TaxID=2969984 RepID=A0ABT1XPB3_9SPHN|nr:DUF2339 domain-containing protein [Parerythrobacter lacustris]MCR2833084.1 DUF2339 domain-containing protein [Parerythrobacter lacustris]